MERSHTKMADTVASYRVFRLDLGSVHGCADSPQQDTHLAPSCVCCRTWRTAVVPDAMGYIIIGIIHPLGRLCRTLSWGFTMAMARSPRRDTRCGTGHDPPSDVITTARMCYTGVFADPRLYMCYGRTRDSTKSTWTKYRIS